MNITQEQFNTLLQRASEKGLDESVVRSYLRKKNIIVREEKEGLAGAQTQSREAFSVPEFADTGNFFQNLKTSAAEAGKNIISLLNPETWKNIGKVGVGAFQKLIPGTQEYEKYADAVGQFFKGRYGSIENVKKTAYEDPVGFVLDLLSLAPAGTLARAGKVGRIAEVAVNPVGLVGKAIKGTAKFAVRVGGEAIGTITGRGFRALKVAFANKTPQFVKAITGQLTPEQIVDDVKRGFDNLIARRTMAGKIGEKEVITKATKPLPIMPLVKEFRTQLDDFGVSLKSSDTLSPKLQKKYPYGKLEFAGSKFEGKLNAIDQNYLQEVHNMLSRLEQEGLKTTAQRLHNLKSSLSIRFPPESRGEVRFIATRLQDKLNNILEKLPGYKEFRRKYKALSDLRDITGKMFISETPDSIMTKLIKAFRDDSDIRFEFLKELEEVGGVPGIVDATAGYMLSVTLPKGQLTKIFAGTTAGYLSRVFPPLIPLFLLSSPNLVGRMLSSLGTPAKIARPIVNFFKETYKYTSKWPQPRGATAKAFQAGRLGEISKEENE